MYAHKNTLIHNRKMAGIRSELLEEVFVGTHCCVMWGDAQNQACSEAAGDSKASTATTGFGAETPETKSARGES